MTKSSQMKIKRKSTPKNKQTQSITPRIPLNAKLENKTLKDKKQEFKNTLKTRHSISSKEDLKKKSISNFCKTILSNVIKFIRNIKWSSSYKLY